MALLGPKMIAYKSLMVAGVVTMVLFQVTAAVVPPVCCVQGSFNSPFIVPYREVISPVIGCCSRALAQRSQEVHVIYLMNKGSSPSNRHQLPEVTVHIHPLDAESVHDGRLIIILHAQRPVQWRVIGERISNSSHHTIVVTKRSKVIENRNLPVIVMPRPEIVIGRVITFVTRRFKAVTSYAEVKDSRKIFLKVGVSTDSPHECNMDDKLASPNVEALLMKEVPVEERSGCVVDGKRSFPKPEVHVIHLRSDEQKKDVSVTNESTAAPLNPLRVLIEVRPISNRIEENNMILVLKAHQPIIWRIQSSNIRGALKIVTEEYVERDFVASTHLIHVKTEELPEYSEDLIFYTDNKYGPLFSYLEVKQADKFEVLIDDEKEVTEIALTSSPTPPQFLPAESKVPRQTNWLQSHPPSVPSSKDFFKAQLGSIRSSKLTGVQVMVKSQGRISSTDLIRMPNVLLMDVMQVDCLPQIIHISFPRLIVERLGFQGSDMTLNDPLCHLVANETHFTRSSPFKGCGTETQQVADRVIYKNAINFHTRSKKTASEMTSSIIREADLLVDDEDHSFEGGSGFGSTDSWKISDDNAEDNLKPKMLEFQCEYSTSGLPLANADQSKMNFNVVSPHWQIYSLDLYRDQDYRTSVKLIDFPLNVIENDRLFVESRIDAGPHLRVVTDECWLSGSNNITDEPKITLVHNTCPTDLSVQMERFSSRHSGLSQIVDEVSGVNMRQWNHFSFQVNSEYMKFAALYLHCMLGVCTVNPEHTSGNIKQCVNLDDYCVSNNLKPFLDQSLGTNHEILTRGPIHIIPKPSERNYQDILSSLAPFLARDKKPDVKNTLSNYGERGEEKIVIQEQPQLILIGLSTEAVVGIAFASFIIGAGLTAILWFIHLRTDPLRNSRNCNSAPHHSGYDLSAHSGSSTPSSQVPMTT